MSHVREKTFCPRCEVSVNIGLWRGSPLGHECPGNE